MNSRTSAFGLSIPTWVYAICAYLLLSPLLLLFAAIFWSYKVSGVWYLCTDGFGIFDFIPPFVHAGTDDVYYAAPWKVYGLWFALLAVALVVPVVVFWLLARLWRGDEAVY